MGKIQPCNLMVLLNNVSHDIINSRLADANYKIQNMIKRTENNEIIKMLYGMLYVCDNWKVISGRTDQISHTLSLAKKVYNGIDMFNYVLGGQFDSYMQGIIFLCEKLSWKYRNINMDGVREIYSHIV